MSPQCTSIVYYDYACVGSDALKCRREPIWDDHYRWLVIGRNNGLVGIGFRRLVIDGLINLHRRPTVGYIDDFIFFPMGFGCKIYVGLNCRPPTHYVKCSTYQRLLPL